MDTNIVKRKVIDAFESVVADLSVEEIEDIQDMLSVQLHKLIDDGTMIDIDNVEKELGLKND